MMQKQHALHQLTSPRKRQGEGLGARHHAWQLEARDGATIRGAKLPKTEHIARSMVRACNVHEMYTHVWEKSFHAEAIALGAPLRRPI
jgi:hypothetical protein